MAISLQKEITGGQSRLQETCVAAQPELHGALHGVRDRRMQHGTLLYPFPT